MINVIDSYRESECESIKHTRTHTHTPWVTSVVVASIGLVGPRRSFFVRYHGGGFSQNVLMGTVFYGKLEAMDEWMNGFLRLFFGWQKQ